MLDSHLPPHPPAKGRMSSKGQIVIPRSIRKTLGYKEGMEFLFEPETDGSCHVRPAKTHSITELFGVFHRLGAKKLSVKDMDGLIMEHVLALDEATKTPHRRKGARKSARKPRS